MKKLISNINSEAKRLEIYTDDELQLESERIQNFLKRSEISKTSLFLSVKSSIVLFFSA